MPKKAGEERGEQVSYLSKKYHEKITSDEFQKIIKTLSEKANYNKLSKIQKIIVDKYKKKLKKLTKLPAIFVEEFSRLTINSELAWREAREKKDFKIFVPYLKKIVDMSKERARLIDPIEHPYNVLLDDYEEGMTIAKLDVVFSKLKKGLKELLKKIQSTEKYKNQKNKLAKIDFPVDGQKRITSDIKKRMGLEEDRTVIMESIHPFSTQISANDVRITTAYRPGKPMFSFTSTVHESGHGLYFLGYPQQYKYSILFDAPSTGLHESQSRFWENQIALREEFWDFYYPTYKTEFKKALGNISKEEFYELINQVRPSLVRIESDEMTYPMHIIIRYELERALMEGKLKVDDLPKEWNAKYNEYLGVNPKNDVEGVMQDIHWSQGSIGYFPTYLIGTTYAAMIFEQIKKDIPDVKKQIQKGEFKNILAWLREKIHSKGATMLAKDIIKEVCHKELDADVFVNYLRDKYEKIYKS